jgi:hypothetical protein
MEMTGTKSRSTRPKARRKVTLPSKLVDYRATGEARRSSPATAGDRTHRLGADLCRTRPRPSPRRAK